MAAKDSLSPEDAMIGELMKKKFSTPPEVTKEEIEAFYAMFKGQMEGKKLEQVAPAIEQIIREGKQQQAVEQYLKEIRNNAKVEIDQDRLKKIAAKPPESNTEEEFKKALAGGKPVLVDFGANNCVPCRQMRPILKELSKEYAGKAEILVIDVYKYQEPCQRTTRLRLFQPWSSLTQRGRKFSGRWEPWRRIRLWPN